MKKIDLDQTMAKAREHRRYGAHMVIDLEKLEKLEQELRLLREVWDAYEHRNKISTNFKQMMDEKGLEATLRELDEANVRFTEARKKAFDEQDG